MNKNHLIYFIVAMLCVAVGYATYYFTKQKEETIDSIVKKYKQHYGNLYKSECDGMKLIDELPEQIYAPTEEQEAKAEKIDCSGFKGKFRELDCMWEKDHARGTSPVEVLVRNEEIAALNSNSYVKANPGMSKETIKFCREYDSIIEEVDYCWTASLSSDKADYMLAVDGLKYCFDKKGLSID